MMRLTVRRRIILLLLGVSILPLVLVNVIWLLSSQAELRDAAAAQQKLLAKSSADAVTYFINGKVDNVIIHSQTAGVQNFQLPEATSDLSSYLKQDEDIAAIALVDAKGQQRLAVNREGVSTRSVDVSRSDAFRIVTFLGGKEYISPVTFDDKNDGYVTLAVPLINFTTTQGGRNLSTAEPGVIRATADIKGALIVTVGVQRLWESVLANKLGKSGYAYVVDDRGNLIAHAKTSSIRPGDSLAKVDEVKAAIAEPQNTGTLPPAPVPRETISETGVEVLSSHYRVARTGWVVVAEEPLASVYARVYDNVKIAFGFFALSAALGVALLLLSVRNLMAPIKALTQGAVRLASGDLGYRIGLRRRDEFGLLAQTFDAMAAKISADITKLQEVDQLKNEFIMIASHNLRTPLTVINGYLDIIKGQKVSPELREMVGAIETSARELSAFSEDMLTISSIEAGGAALDLADTTIGELLEPVRLEINNLAAKKGVMMAWKIPEATTKLRLSPVHIRSAISNLLYNALEFTAENGKVEFELVVEAQRCTMTVRDTGTGIEPKELTRLFTKFHRGTSTYQYDHPGTGIGLYATRLIVEAHQGLIEATSQTGKGSTFTIRLPLQH